MDRNVFTCPYDGREFPLISSETSVTSHFCGGCANFFRVWRGPVIRRASESRVLRRKTAGESGEYEREYSVELATPHGPRTFKWVLPSREEDVYIRAKDDVIIVQAGTSIGDQVCGAGRVWPWSVLGWRVRDRRRKERLETLPGSAAIVTLVAYLWGIGWQVDALGWAVGVGLLVTGLTVWGTQVAPARLAEVLPAPEPAPTPAMRGDAYATALTPPLKSDAVSQQPAIRRPRAKVIPPE